MEHEDYYFNDNVSIDYDQHPSYDYRKIQDGIMWTVVVFGLPLTLLAMALCLKGLKDHVAPVYVINLLISNLIQLCCFIVFLTNVYPMMNISDFIYFYGVTASVFFRLVVATDRCLFITRPEWYMDRTSITRSVVVSVGIWALSVVVLCIIFYFNLPLFYIEEFLFMFFGVFLLVPFLLLLFLLVGSVKASFAASSDKNNSNLVILVLLLLFYAVLFLPLSICSLLQNIGIQQTFIFKTLMLLWFVPVADLVVYVFIRKANNKPHAVAAEQTAHQQHEMDGI